MVTTVLTALAAPFGATGDPNSPLESPALWVMAAAARRQFGQTRDAQLAATPPVDAVTTGEGVARAMAAAAVPMAAAAAAPNLPPLIGLPIFETPDPVDRGDHGSGER